jgi:DivIVA domain-containing protein
MARKRKRGEEEAGFGEATAGFGEEQAGPKRDRLTPVDVQQKVFRLAFRGYNERDVDEFLDHITEDLAALHEENKRLREQLTEGGMSSGGAGAGGAARQQAEAIVRQAREHAARLVEDAGRRAGSAGAATGGPPPPSSYLVREREFLQTLASLVQDHARTLKEQAQRARAAGGEDQRPSSTEAPGPAAAAEPETPSRSEAIEPPEAPGPLSTEEPGRPEGRSSSSEAGAASAPPPQAAIVIPPAASETETERGSTVKVETASASTAEGPSEAAADQSEGGDPLLSAWETAFSGDEEEPEGEQGRRGDRDRAEEPSLRELFWGEE